MAHLRFASPEAPELLFGDRGDGYFNFWVLEQVSLFLSGWLEHGLSSVQSFWPEHEVAYWWSDNLLAPGFFFHVIKHLTPNSVAAAYFTGVLGILALYACSGWMFWELFRSHGHHLKSPLLFCVPLMAYVTTFSEARLVSFTHFQNIWSLGLVLLVTAGIRYLRFLKLRDLLLMGVAELFLLFSSPYQAQLGLVLGTVWLFCAWVHPGITWSNWWRTQAPWLMLFAPPALWIVLQYAQVGTPEYLKSELHSMSVSFANLFRSQRGGWVQLEKHVYDLHPGGYLGIGVWLSVVSLLLGMGIVYHRHLGSFFTRKPVLIALLVLGISFLDIRELTFLFVWLQLGVYLWLAGRGVRVLRKRESLAEELPLLFMGVCALLTFGVSAGPLMQYETQWLNPSPWGIYEKLIPGFAAMRELVRFAATGQTLLIALLWGLWLRKVSANGSRLILASGLLFMGLQVVEMQHTDVIFSTVEPETELTEEEAAFFRSVPEGQVMLVTPCAPFHRNSLYQLTWQPIETLWMVNGYSGRSSELLQEAMKLEMATGPASSELAEWAATEEIDLYCLPKRWVESSRQQMTKQRWPVLFENDRFLVVRLQDSLPAETPVRNEKR